MAKAAGRPMTKSQILDHVATETELPKRKINEVMETLVNLSYREAKNGFAFPGLGKLVLSNRKARTGRNPQTGEAIKIPARTVVRFRIGKAAKDMILGGTAGRNGKAKAKAAPKAKAKAAPKAKAKAGAKRR
jgi:DNA-binding protein HU-beta